MPYTYGSCAHYLIAESAVISAQAFISLKWQPTEEEVRYDWCSVEKNQCQLYSDCLVYGSYATRLTRIKMLVIRRLLLIFF